MSLPDFVPLIEFNWTVAAVIWVIVLVIVATMGASGIGGRAKRATTVLSIGGSLAIAWALLADLGEIPAGRTVPDVTPMFLSLWGLAMLVLVPFLFVIVGGARSSTFHPTIAPVAYLAKGVTFLGSVLGIVGFYLQHMS